MICVKCGQTGPDYPFCPWCGWRQSRKPTIRSKRGNGEGSVYQMPNGKWQAAVILGYYVDDKGKKHRLRRTKIFDKKKDAIAALQTLRDNGKVKKKTMTFKQVYDAWAPTHKAGKSTMDNYKYAVRYFTPLYPLPFAEVDVDDLQDCIDECPKGRRTKENMRAAVGLMYKYAIPRHLTNDNLNLAQYLTVDGDGPAHRDAFTEKEIEQMFAKVNAAPYLSDVLVMCYTGFRPSEYLALTMADYNAQDGTLTGGAKTEAGRGRVVTLSPKIKPLAAKNAATDGALCADPEGKAWGDLKKFSEDAFYPALDAAGISNPMVEIGGGIKRHRLTPHSCRHTFATLVKRVPGADKDKLELIGHTSDEMLRHYQDVTLDDLRKITDAI